VLSAIAPAEAEAVVAETMLSETTSIGVRVREVKRYEARREMRLVATPFGEVRVKVKWVGGAIAGAMPEYEDCARLAGEKAVAVRVVWEAAVAAGSAEYCGGSMKEPRS
jgi:uncharacterized protein (DUF111 family)